MPVAYLWRTRAPSRIWAGSRARIDRLYHRSTTPVDVSVSTKRDYGNNHNAVAGSADKAERTRNNVGRLNTHALRGIQDQGSEDDTIWLDSPTEAFEERDLQDAPGQQRALSRDNTSGQISTGRLAHTSPATQSVRMEHCNLLEQAIKRHRAYLGQLGYDNTHIQTWYDIANGQDVTSISNLVHRTGTHINGPYNQRVPTIPLFVISSLSLRSSLAPSVLRIMLVYLDRLCHEGSGNINSQDTTIALEILSGGPVDPARVPWLSTAEQSRLSNEMMLILQVFSNLIYHARHSQSELLEPITSSFLAWLPLTRSLEVSQETTSSDSDEYNHSNGDGLLETRNLAALTFSTNAILQLLALPCKSRSFKSSTSQEAAQVRVVQFMANHQPPLELSRQGYRSITSVQLMLKKTPQEIRWTELQSLSWPPWKHDRTAMDSRIGPDYGTSNAMQALLRMKEVGYKPAGWEDVAKVYTGWDDDGSPTVQTRQYLGPFPKWQAETIMWSARVRTTRTIREAWAAFQAYWDSGTKWRPSVCQAMLEKILLAARREAKLKHDDQAELNSELLLPSQVGSKIHPGEVKEIWPSPPSSHLETYTRSPPPTLAEFLSLVIQHDVVLDDDALQHLLPLIISWHDAKLLLDSMRPDISTRDPYNIATLFTTKEVPSLKLGSLLLQYLLQFPPKARRTTPLEPSNFRVGSTELNHTALGLGFAILTSPYHAHDSLARYFLDHLNRQAGLARYPSDNEEVVVLKSGLVNIDKTYCRLISTGELGPFRAHIDRMAALQLALTVIHSMQSKQVSFGQQSIVDVLSIGASSAQAARDVILKLDEHELHDNVPSLLEPAAHLLVDEARQCRETIATKVRSLIFDMMQMPEHFETSQDSASSTDPAAPGSMVDTQRLSLRRLAVTPSPAILHAAIRCFGAADDFDGIRQTVHFMQKYWREIETAMEQDRNGKTMLRRTLCAVNLFLAIGSNAIRRDLTKREVVDLFLEKHMRQGNNAPDEVIEDVYTIAEKMDKEWGGWPLPMEVEMYIMKRKDRVTKK
ncbi:Hypothetical protein D9617_26g078310 [Elsinoe fawcettii]|nr:Hypothetical protein D9617_26g078310 [Elsinoe fawcettii]